MRPAWWESIDYGLSEEEKLQVAVLSEKIAERAQQMRYTDDLLRAAKKLGTVLKDYRKEDIIKS